MCGILKNSKYGDRVQSDTVDLVIFAQNGAFLQEKIDKLLPKFCYMIGEGSSHFICP